MRKPVEIDRVSVILPTFNRALYLGDAIRSLLDQTERVIEIIVIDDGSTDSTAEVCAAFGDNVRYIRQPTNRGKMTAINLGLREVRGDYVWIMDDDDLAPPDALAHLIAPMRADRSLGYTFGLLQKFRDTAEGRRNFDAPQDPFDPDGRPFFVRLLEDCFITGQPCVLFRRNAIAAHAPYDQTVLASVDYFILLTVARSAHGAAVDQTVLFQRQHGGQRGPHSLRYGEAERIKRWMAFDSRIVETLLETVEDGELIGRRGRALSTIEQRRAWFQRATVAGRKRLWDLAARSLRQARALSAAPLTPGDRQILKQMLGSRYGIDIFANSATIQSAIIDAAGDGLTGESIRRAIAAKLTYWAGQAALKGDFARARAALSALFRLTGPRGVVAAFGDVASRRFGGSLAAVSGAITLVVRRATTPPRTSRQK
jgi:hypothetical protein